MHFEKVYGLIVLLTLSMILNSQTVFKDFSISPDGEPVDLVATDDLLFFGVYTHAHGRELWKSDGTVNGTVIVRDMITINSYANPHNIYRFDNKVVYSGADSTIGYEPCISDGTIQGTFVLKDIDTNNRGSNPRSFIQLGNKVIFTAEQKYQDFEPYITDGSKNGTKKLKEINPNGTAMWSSAEMVKLGNEVFFVANDGIHGYELWKTDGNDIGTKLVKNIRSGGFGSFNGYIEFKEYNGEIYFACDDNYTGYELWKSNGTDSGTVLVKNIHSVFGHGDSDPKGFTELNGILYFAANEDNYSRQLYRTDGTGNGTYMVDSITGPRNPGNITLFGNKLIFTASGINGVELWISDGTANGTYELKDIDPGSNSSYPKNFFSYAGRVYFSASDADGNELWVTDGTSNGTVKLKDIYAGIGNSDPHNFVAFKERIFFIAQNANVGEELFWYNPCSGKNVSNAVSVMDTTLTATEKKASYQWKYCGDQKVLLNSATDSAYAAEISGKYKVTITKKGCLKESKCEQVDVPIPISVSGDSLHGKHIQGGTYQWIDCDSGVLISGATFSSIPAPYDGKFSMIISKFGITDTSDCISYEKVGINEEWIKNNIKVYPIPSGGIFNIESEKTIESIRVLNHLGSVVLNYKNVDQELNTFDLTNFSGTLFILEVNTSRGTFRQKIIKKK